VAIERRNPLPSGGVYWVDVIGEEAMKAFTAWRQRNAVKVIRTRYHEAVTSHLWGLARPAREWVLFETTQITPWEGPGLPTIASRATTEADTVQKPDPEGPRKLPAWLPLLAAAGAGGLLVWWLTSRQRPAVQVVKVEAAEGKP
jgi:hypothetical protein